MPDETHNLDHELQEKKVVPIHESEIQYVEDEFKRNIGTEFNRYREEGAEAVKNGLDRVISLLRSKNSPGKDYSVSVTETANELAVDTITDILTDSGLQDSDQLRATIFTFIDTVDIDYLFDNLLDPEKKARNYYAITKVKDGTFSDAEQAGKLFDSMNKIELYNLIGTRYLEKIKTQVKRRIDYPKQVEWLETH